MTSESTILKFRNGIDNSGIVGRNSGMVRTIPELSDLFRNVRNNDLMRRAKTGVLAGADPAGKTSVFDGSVVQDT